MPVWVPLTPETTAFMQVSVSRAVAKGLTYRPLEVTARETLAWHRTRPAERQATLRTGIKPDREKEVLVAWHATGK
jgi:2'-hydroxyisoflavone reductase